MKRVIDFLMGKQGRGAASGSGATLVDREGYQQLKAVFDTTFELLEDNFSKEHPDKHYLSSALKFKLPGTEHIDGTKQEVTFSTYNTLFARTSADFMQRHGLGNVSLNVLQDPAKLTLSQLNIEAINTLQQKLQQQPVASQPTQSFTGRLEAERSSQSQEKGR